MNCHNIFAEYLFEEKFVSSFQCRSCEEISKDKQLSHELSVEKIQLYSVYTQKILVKVLSEILAKINFSICCVRDA